MASQTFICPHCNHQNTKSDQLYILSAAHEAKSTTIIMSTTAPAEFIYCQYCRQPVEKKKVIEGVYDVNKKQVKPNGATILVSVIVVIMALKFLAEWGWVASVLVGFFLGMIVSGIAAQIASAFSKRSAAIIFLFLSLNAHTQQWTGMYVKVVNLTPKAGNLNLKKWYLSKLSSPGLTGYHFNSAGMVTDSAHVYLKNVATPPWLQGYAIVPSDDAVGWTYNGKTAMDYYVVKDTVFSNDSCCGCDEANAFKVLQALTYKGARFYLTNMFISPLCVRKKENNELQWYAPGNFAHNTGNAKTKNARFIGSSKVMFNITAADNGAGPIDLLLKDIRSKKLVAYDAADAKNTPIPAGQFLTWKCGADTLMVADDKTGEMKKVVKQNSLSPADFTHIKLLVDWYFDSREQKLFSVVRSGTLYISLKRSESLPAIKVAFAKFNFQ